MTRTLAVLFAVVAAPALAFDGRYGACTVTSGEDLGVEIRGDRLAFAEADCRLTNPVQVRDMDGAVLFDLACSAEGEDFVDRAFLQPAWDGGLLLVLRGAASHLPRCP